MKLLIKYSVTLLILLIVYGQLVAPLYMGTISGSSTQITKGTEYVHALDIKRTEVVAICTEEWEEKDEELISFKKNSQDPSYISFIHAQEHFLQPIKSYSFFGKHSSGFSFFRPPYLVFRVFRL